ncbi:MAG: N-acetylglucosamine kinase [Actinomycetota bacterium]
MTYVLGIDGGGTKTICLLMDQSSQILSRGEAGPSNYQTIGLEAAGHSIQSAIAAAVSPLAGVELSITAIGLGLAGVGRPEDVEAVRNLVQQLQLNRELPIKWSLQPDTIVISSDSIIALVGGTGRAEGIVVIAGTGSQIFGQNRQGKTKRVGGWGYLLGDEGSGYQIAIQGLQAVMRSYDGRLEPTTLTQAFQTGLNLKNTEELIPLIYRRGWGVKDIAALAPIVEQAAAEGDRIAQQIMTDAVAELVLAVKVTISALFHPDESLEIVTMGGVWQGATNFRGQFTEAMAAIAPLATVIWPKYEPAYGAGLLALNALTQKSR